ncbi:MAG: hypothetical protein V1802_00190 [Candidatus Aenigmatarchaeota archaeon]
MGEKQKKRFEKYGLNPDYVSYFHRHKYDSDRFAGRGFYPNPDGEGRFIVDLDWIPSDYPSDVDVFSLPVYKLSEPEEAAMKVNALPQKVETK